MGRSELKLKVRYCSPFTYYLLPVHYSIHVVANFLALFPTDLEQQDRGLIHVGLK